MAAALEKCLICGILLIHMKDINESYRWPFGDAPAGASTWVVMVGRLSGYGQSRYLALPDYFCPHVVVSGRGFVKALGRTWEVGPGDMFTLWPGVGIEYWEEPSEPWTFYWLHLSGPGREGFNRALGFAADEPVAVPSNPARVEELFGRLHQLMGKADVHDAHLALATLYGLPLACGGGQAPAPRDLLDDAVEVVDSRLGTGLNVNELGEILKVSRATLYRAFAIRLGVSPAAYIAGRRLELAEKLLRGTSYNAAEVARLCGFSSEKYFFRRFKELSGKTPGAARSGGRGGQLHGV